jgi:hypothetical protein
MSVTTNPLGPRQIVLFSGHLIDAVDREQPRFPPSREGTAAAAIAAALEDLRVGPDDVGMTEGACGGDLLFAEACLSRGASLELRLPFLKPVFIEKSVAYAKKTPPPDRWLERFHDVGRHERVNLLEMPNASAGLPDAEDPYERCNLWMLRDTLAFGGSRPTIICLWNGAGGDGPGGTAHMMQCVRAAGGKVVWLDTRKLWSI